MKQIYLVNKSKAVLGLFSGVKSRITLTQPLFKHYCVLTVALMLLLGGFSTRVWGQLPYGTTMTESYFNDSKTVVQKVAEGNRYAWASGGIRLGYYTEKYFLVGTKQAPGNWDDKYVVIALSQSGIPYQLKFKHKCISYLDATYADWYVSESTSKDGPWTEVWSTTSNSTSLSSLITKDLSRTTKYIKLCYSGNYAGLFSNISVSELQYINDPSTTSLDCGTAFVDEDSTSNSFTIEWCNVPAMQFSLSGTDSGKFKVYVTNNSQTGQYNTATITVKCAHTAVGKHSAKLTVTDTYDSYSKEISLSGETKKKTPKITWNPDSRVFNAEDVLTATSALGTTVVLSVASGNAGYVSCSENTATMLAPKSDSILVTATITGNDTYKDTTYTRNIWITSKEKQTISWDQDYELAHFKTNDATKSLTLNATASSGLPVSYELVGEKTGLTLTKSGNTWTLTYSANECKNTTIVAKQEGDEEYAAAASISFPVKVVDPTQTCGISETLINKSVTLRNESQTYDLEIPASLSISISRTSSILAYANGFKIEFFSEKKGAGTLLKTVSYTKNDIKNSKSAEIDLTEFIHAKSVKITSEAINGYNVTALSYTKRKYHSISSSSLSFATSPNTESSAQTFTVGYANYPITLECTNSKFSFTPTEFGDCGIYGSQTVSVTYTAGADEGEDSGYIYVVDNTGARLETCTLTVSVSKVVQSITTHTIETAYNTTDRVELSAEANSGLTNFVYSATPAGVASFDGNVMTFSKSGTIAITVTQPGSNVYAATSATVENVVVSPVAPTLTAPLGGTAVTYLQTLSNSTLSNDGTAKVTLRGVANTDVVGSFAWTDKDHQVVETPGSNSYSVTFTPTDGGMYTTNTCSVAITVNKKDQELEMNNGNVYVKVNGIDAEATDSRLNLNTLIASQTTDPVAASRAGEVSYEVISAEGATISDATISGSTFYATAIGTYTIVATKAATDYYTQKTDTFTVVVKKRANTLTVVGAQEKYVDQNVTSVASLINSDASLQYSSTAEDIARYDVANNRIVVDNSASKSFDDTLVTISIWQEANSQFEASGVKTIDVTVKKRENAISYTWDGQAHTSWIEKLNFDQSATVLFSATNTQTGCPDVTVAQTYGSLNASYTQAENKIKASYINDSYATWQISQAESRTYQGATATLRVNVGTETSTGCDLYVSDWWDEEKTASQIHIPMPETGTAGELTFDMRKNGSLGDDALLCIQVGTQWDTIHVWAKEKDNYKAPNGITLPYTLDPNTTAIRFDKYATALSGFEITSDDPFIRNIHVTRKTWLKLEDADKNEISKLVMPTNTVSLFGSNSRTAEFYINYSTCDSKVHIASNNSSISTSVSEFDIDHLGRKRIIVTYTSNQVENINATITVYTQYENKTLTIEAKTEKENQSIIWANGYTGNPLTLPLGLNAVNAATSTSHAPVTYTSQNESIIKVSDDGLSFQMMGAGTTTLTAYAEGDDTHWNPVSETKTVTVSGKQVQQIVWTHNYTHGLHPGETANLDAIAMVINAQTGAGTKNDSLTALIAYEAINNDCVISISGNTLNLLKEGNAQIKATLAGSDEFETAEPVILDVHVRAVSTGECDPSYMFESGQGEELGFYAFDGSPSLVGGLHWETPELFNYVILNHDNTSGDPDTLTYSVRGKAYRALGSDHFQGTIEVWESEDGINYTKVANSVVQPVQDQTVPSGKIVLKSTTTHLKFVRPANGQGYHYVRDIKVTRLAALTSDNTIVNGLPEVNLGDVMAGAERNDVITFTYASVKGDLTTSKQNSTNSNNVLTINEPVIELDCGDFDTHDLPITFRPMEAGPWSEEVKITDPLADMSYTVRVKANVTVGAQMIIWNPTQTIDFDEPPLLDGYATSGLTVSYSVTAGTDVATIENGIVVLHKPGSFTITASQGGNASFSPADDVVIPFTVTLSHYTYTGNGNWEDDSNWNVVPEGEHPDVIVRGDLEINDTVTVGSMTIESNGSVMVVDNGTLTVNGTSEDRSGYGDLHVEKEGHVFLNGGELKVNKFILDATLNDIVNGQEAKSGQVTNPTRLDIIETAYFDLDMDPDGQVTFGWYDFTVPFDVNISNGIFRLNNDGSTTPLVSGRDFIVTYYDEARRAAGQKGWVQMNGSAQLTAGVAYSITLDDEVTQNTIRFVWNKQHSIGASYTTPVTRSNNGTTTNRGWNGIGNGTLTHTQLQGLPANTKVQMYDHSTKSFRAVDAADYTYAVGTAFFYQAPENPSPVVQTKADGTLLLPLRAPQYENRTVNEFRLTLTEESTAREVDVLYVSASEEATGEYTVGHDLLKMASANEVSIAQIWATNGKLQLCDIEMPLINNNAICDLGLNAPKEGAYILEIQRAPEDAMLYLTYEGRAIWNLSYSPYVFDLAKGTTEGYGLKLYANPAPQVATGVDEMDAEAQTMRKVMIDNVLYIITPDGAMYDVTGKSIK